MIESEEIIAKVKDLRALILTMGPGQCLSWHHHSEVTETIFCSEGPIQVETRDPEGERVLAPGEMMVITPGRSHKVSGISGGRCKVLLILGVGNWDFIADSDLQD